VPRLCCLLFALLTCTAEVASAAPAPLPRPARKVEWDSVAEVNRQFAARGVTEWRFVHPKGDGHCLVYLLPAEDLYSEVQVVDGDRARAVREALAEIDRARARKPR
jgi:hypothetical protein